MNDRFRFALAAVLCAVASASHAALPVGSADAIEAYGNDVVAVFGLLIAAGIAIYAVRKLGQKMGWLDGGGSGSGGGPRVELHDHHVWEYKNPF